jgi:hypothetical protein
MPIFKPSARTSVKADRFTDSKVSNGGQVKWSNIGRRVFRTCPVPTLLFLLFHLFIRPVPLLFRPTDLSLLFSAVCTRNGGSGQISGVRYPTGVRSNPIQQGSPISNGRGARKRGSGQMVKYRAPLNLGFNLQSITRPRRRARRATVQGRPYVAESAVFSG